MNQKCYDWTGLSGCLIRRPKGRQTGLGLMGNIVVFVLIFPIGFALAVALATAMLLVELGLLDYAFGILDDPAGPVGSEPTGSEVYRMIFSGPEWPALWMLVSSFVGIFALPGFLVTVLLSARRDNWSLGFLCGGGAVTGIAWPTLYYLPVLLIEAIERAHDLDDVLLAYLMYICVALPAGAAGGFVFWCWRQLIVSKIRREAAKQAP